jgi:triphosphoribosyl-dephospho-CoA synthase
MGDKISWAAQMACLLEVSADKPGNVTRHNGFNDSCFEDFIISASAIGPAFRCASNASVGQTILRAIQDTRRFVGVNTNLGIVLMLAPLAKAVGFVKSYGPVKPDELRRALGAVLKELSVHDAVLAYEAIRLANPGGLGEVKQHDSKDKNVSISLYEAMELARTRDSLAKEYVTDFKITFEIGLPAFKEALGKGAKVSPAVVQTFLSILARVPDTLIARKKGMEKALDVSKKAGQILNKGGVFSPKGSDAISLFDAALRDEKHGLNPGTTADLVAAVLFVFLLENDLPPLGGGDYILPGNPAIVE